jgi:FAD/FMN-containing dehydrogenase
MAKPDAAAIAAFRADIDGIAVDDNPATLRQKSRDFFWYSPVLKERLDGVVGDLVVSPASEAEVTRVLAAAWRHRIPITPRGAGTGNYGQAMPLAGGAILNLAGLDKVIEIGGGTVRAEAGAILAAIDAETQARAGRELRLHPSTYRTATIGGFIAGGSGGVGSIRWGGLRDPGNVVSLRVVTLEESPRVLELQGDDLAKVAHAYGTNGIITEVTMPLAAAEDWVDVLVAFDDFLQAAAFARDLGLEDGICLKELAVVAAPVAHDYFLRHQRFFRRDQSVVVVMAAAPAMAALAGFAARDPRAAVVYRSDRASEAERQGLPPAYELAWNHTTLRGLRVDPTITYLQVLYPAPDILGCVERVTAEFGDECPGHLEFVRFDGALGCFGLPIVRYTTEERLDAIVRRHEELGAPIFNPHRYTLEEGGMKRSDPVQLAFKREADPLGLLNPGKMIAWEDPAYDFGADKLYLFSGLGETGATHVPSV